VFKPKTVDVYFRWAIGSACSFQHAYATVWIYVSSSINLPSWSLYSSQRADTFLFNPSSNHNMQAPFHNRCPHGKFPPELIQGRRFLSSILIHKQAQVFVAYLAYFPFRSKRRLDFPSFDIDTFPFLHTIRILRHGSWIASFFHQSACFLFLSASYVLRRIIDGGP
jgi:hypothetical protein